LPFTRTKTRRHTVDRTKVRRISKTNVGEPCLYGGERRLAGNLGMSESRGTRDRQRRRAASAAKSIVSLALRSHIVRGELSFGSDFDQKPHGTPGSRKAPPKPSVKPKARKRTRPKRTAPMGTYAYESAPVLDRARPKRKAAKKR
jgi:hypothetical protein